MSTQETLIGARALISDCRNWCQGPIGEEVPSAPYCAMGAIKAVNEDDETACFRALVEVVGQGVRGYNDTHDHGCVLALFDAAIEASG